MNAEGRPNIRIHHFFVWCACIGLHAAVSRYVVLSTVHVNDNAMYQGYPGLIFWLSVILNGIIWGTAMAGFMVVVTEYQNGEIYRFAPGHCILVSLGIPAIVGLTIAGMASVLGIEIADPESPTSLLQFGITSVLQLLILLFCLVVVTGWCWRIYFSFNTLVLIGAFFEGTRSWTTIGSILISLALLASVIVDCLDRIPRDWLHWTGVIVIWSSIAAQFAIMILESNVFTS